MEQAYRIALKIILKYCTEEDFISAKTIRQICETALEVEENEEKK